MVGVCRKFHLFSIIKDVVCALLITSVAVHLVDIMRELVWCLAPIGRRPIRAFVATVSFKLVRTRISIGWLLLFNAVIPQKSEFLALLGSGVPPPVNRYKSYDVGGGVMPTPI
jgi:hypothetical protein